MPAEPGPGGRAAYTNPKLQVIFGVTLMAVLGVASIAPVLPRVVEALAVDRRQVGLLVTVFTLPGVVLTPLLGVVGDRWGRRRVLVPALLLFAAAGGACALARSFPVLLALRFFQGVGAAPLGALNVTIIGDLFAGRERTTAMGYNASVLSMGTATYPALGGLLGAAAWYWPFALPLLAVPVALAVRRVDAPEPRSREPFRPYLRALWRNLMHGRVLVLVVLTAATFILLYGALLTYLPLLLAERFAASTAQIGLVLSAVSLTTAATSSRLGMLAARVPEGRLVVVACAGYAASLATVPFLPSIVAVGAVLLVFGAAQALNLPVLFSLLAGLAPGEQRAAFMSINGFVLRLGQTLGPLLMGVAYGLGGFEAVYLAGTAVAVAMLLLAAAGLGSARAG